jgi:hypothetical protein
MRDNGPRITRAVLGALLLLTALAGSASAQQEPAGRAPEIAPPPSPHPAARSKLLDFGWLEGHWQGVWGPRIVEQDWMAPKGGTMLGMFRAVENDKTLVMELFALVETPEKIELRFRHFTPSLMTWEQSGSTILDLDSVDPHRATFENPFDGQPKRVTYARIDADTFVARSEIVPDSGDTQVSEITYHREKPPAEQTTNPRGKRR